MKKLLFVFLLTGFALSCVVSQQSPQQTSQKAAELTFLFTRQSGSASNQFAVWVEDAQGKHIKTLYATRWTANGGWSRRPTSIPIWVRQSDLSNMSKAQIDAVSGATPRTGPLTYVWDGTDSRGAAVPAGNYELILEGTLRWEDQVLYRIPIRPGQGPSVPQARAEYTGNRTDERSMISEVTVRVF